MKIYIKESPEKKGFHLYIPNGILWSHFTQWIIAKSLEDHAPDIDTKQIVCLLKGLKESVAIHGHYELVNVESKNGETVRIRL